jgi:hypothetical protein
MVQQQMPDMEVGDQDILIPNELAALGEGLDQGCALIQVKFSQRLPPPPLGRSDLKEIAKGLVTAKNEMPKLGLTPKTLFLVSNRGLNEDAKHDLAEAQHNNRLPDYTVPQLNVLRELRPIVEAPTSMWLDRLRLFGARYGLLEEEIAAGIDRLVSQFIGHAVDSNLRLDRRDLVRAFAGDPGARMVRYADVAAVASDWLRDQDFSAPKPFQQRRQFDEDLSAATKRHALVLLHGQGGCGKTLALKRWAWEGLGETPATARACVNLQVCSNIEDGWISATIDRWSNANIRSRLNQPRGRRSIHEALDRIERANHPPARPILHFGLDGLDELPEQSQNPHGEIGMLLRWFTEHERHYREGRGELRATLVVTCRERELLDRFLTSDRPMASGRYENLEEDTGQEEHHRIAITSFDTQELLAAASTAERSGLLESDELTLLESLMRSVQLANDVERFPRGAGDFPSLAPPANQPVEGEPITLPLHHPAMWAAFLDLPASRRREVLSGSRDGRIALADQYVGHFLMRLNRRSAACNLSNDEVKMLLSAAEHHNRGKAWQTTAAWLAGAARSEVAGQLIYKRIFNESVSWGIIEKEGNRWRWRYALISEYLMVTSGRQGKDDG